MFAGATFYMGMKLTYVSNLTEVWFNYNNATANLIAKDLNCTIVVIIIETKYMYFMYGHLKICEVCNII